MNGLWERRSYANLGLTSQNYLRDQAARLEKTMENLSGNTNENEDILYICIIIITSAKKIITFVCLFLCSFVCLSQGYLWKGWP